MDDSGTGILEAFGGKLRVADTQLVVTLEYHSMVETMLGLERISL
jgi:hypothetical protein